MFFRNLFFVLLWVLSIPILAQDLLTGVHVRHQMILPDVISETVNPPTSDFSKEEMCQLYFNKSFKVHGDIEKVKQATKDVYYTADGSMMAEYTIGHAIDSNQSGPCEIYIIESKTINIYDINKLTLYSYSYHDDSWQKKKIPGKSQGIESFDLLNEAVFAQHGRPQSLGKDVIAGLMCEKYQLNDMVWCEWNKDSSKYDGFEIPVKLTLSSQIGKQEEKNLNSSVVEFVNFKAQLDKKLFALPTNYLEIP